jgi:hypothetical protein
MATYGQRQSAPSYDWHAWHGKGDLSLEHVQTDALLSVFDQSYSHIIQTSTSGSSYGCLDLIPESPGSRLGHGLSRCGRRTSGDLRGELGNADRHRPESTPGATVEIGIPKRLRMSIRITS